MTLAHELPASNSDGPANESPCVDGAEASKTGVIHDPEIPILYDARVKAWPPNKQEAEGVYWALSKVLTTEFTSDAHFSGYSRPDAPARLKNEALALLGGGVPMVLMVFDVDDEAAHRTGEPASDTWFTNERAKWEKLNQVHAGSILARSKGGYRIIFRLSQEFVICNGADKARWSLLYRGCCAYLARAFGIVADPACADWTRLFRAPHATRAGSATPERREVVGDPFSVGTWDYIPDATSLDADIAVAEEIASRLKGWKGGVLTPLQRFKRDLSGPHLAKPRLGPLPSVTPDASANRTSPAPTDERIQKAAVYLASLPAAVQGDGGDAITFKAALAVVKGFGLPADIAIGLLLREYNPRCRPPWDEPALRHKVACAEKSAAQTGYLLHGAKKATVLIRTEECEVVDEVLVAVAANSTLYQRGGVLVQVVRDDVLAKTEDDGGLKRPPHSPRIMQVTIPRLREEMTRAVQLMRIDGEGRLHQRLHPVHPPKWLPDEFDARGCWPGMRHLEGVVETPVLRPDGTVLQDAGYDIATRILYEPNGAYVPVAPFPTREEALKARDTLLEVFADFPFSDEAHRAATLAATITPYAMFAYDGPAPLIGIDAPTAVAGSGKSLLSDVIAVMATGRVMPRMAQAPDEVEERKRITSIALSGERLVLVDNLTRPLGSGALDAALTTPGEWTDRLLGSNKIMRARLHVLWFATANNMQVAGDTARRILNVRIDPKVERPEERTGFVHSDLLAWVRSERVTLVHAALTLLRGFVAAGAPSSALRPWGSFDGWSRIVRAAVVFVGLPDPGDTRNALRGRADTEAAAFGDIVTGLETLLGGHGPEHGREAAEIVQTLNSLPAAHARLRTAFSEIRHLRSGQTLDAQALGFTLRKLRDRIVGGRRLAAVKVGDRQKWFVEATSL